MATITIIHNNTAQSFV